MTPQEEQLIRNLADRVNSTKLQEKDPEAETLLQSSFGSNPDSLYILAQTVLVQNFALEQARAQVADLQKQVQQAQQPAHSGSFLGNLFGHRDPVAPLPQQSQFQQPQYNPAAASQQYNTDQPFQPVRQAGAPQAYAPVAPAYAVAPQQQYVAMGGQPSFLRGAMQTAAGVAAGALAFEGVESILHGFSHPGFGWGGPGVGGIGTGAGFGGGFERPVEETVVNNYYDDPGRSHDFGSQEFGRHEGGEVRQFNDEPLHHESRDSADQGQAQVSDASYNSQGNDNSSYDPNAYNPPDPYLQQDPQAGFDQGNSDQSNYDQGGFDQASNDPGQDSGGFGDSGGFDTSGGGFDSGSDFS